MANADSMVARVRRLCGLHTLLTYDLAMSFINQRHSEFLDRHDWSRRKQEIVVNSSADKTDGTIAATQGSATITGTSTTFAAADVGKSIRIGDDDYPIYNIKAVGGLLSLTLGDLNGTTVTWPGDSVSGATYTIFQQWYQLGTNVEDIVSVKHQTRLREVSTEWLDWKDPSRNTTGDDPTHFARGPRERTGTSDIVRIELWPRPSSPISVNVAVKLGHTDLAPSKNPIVPSDVLCWYAAEDGCYFLFAKTKEPKWIQLAQEYDKQGATAYELARAEDSKKFGVIQAVQDINGGNGLSETDFALDHDTGV